MSKKAKNLISLLLNLFIVIDMVYCISTFFTKGGQGNMAVASWRAFRYFTIDSNVLCALSCAAAAYFNIRGLKAGELILPSWAVVFKFAGTVAVTVTFLVVMLFLGPTQGYGIMMEGVNAYMHLYNALAALLGFLVFEKGFPFPKSRFHLGNLSVIIYGTLYLIMVLILKLWPDFYGFNTVIKWWISYPGMIIFGYGLSFLIWRLYTAKKS